MVFPMFGFYPAFSENLLITTIFTIVSIIRSYIWRRVFNALEHRGILK